MKYILKKKKITKVLCFVILILIVIDILTDHDNIALADWATLDGVPNGIQYAEVGKNSIIQVGRHNAAADNAVRYKTDGYYMSLEPFNINMKMNTGSNATKAKYYVPVDIIGEQLIGSEKEVTYEIKKKNFMDAVTGLGITGEALKATGSKSVYMSNIFDIMKGNSLYQGRNDIFGYQEMLEQAGWSTETVENLKGYYNFRYILTPVIYKVEYYPVYMNGSTPTTLEGAKNKSGTSVPRYFASKDIIFTEQVNDFTLSEANKELIRNGTSYQYQHWYYNFEGKKNGPNPDSTVRFEAPDANEDYTLKVYLVYESQPTDYTVRVIAETSEGNQLMTLKAGTAVTSGDTYQYTIQSPKTMSDDKDYIYQNNTFLTYIDPDGTKKTVNVTTTKSINFKMPAAKQNSQAVFHVVYDLGPAPSPTPTPPGAVTPTPPPELPPIIIPEPDSASLSFTTVQANGVLRADIRSSERFVSTLGVPTTESLYGEVTASKYLLGYNFVKKVGIKAFPVEVTKNYILEWYSATPDEAGGKQLVTETVPITQTIMVERAYGFWEIANLECYAISNAIIRNFALPDGSIIVTPDYSQYSPPLVFAQHLDSMDDHVLPPDEAVSGIQLPDETIAAPEESETRKPVIPPEDFTYEAKLMTGEAKVKSDFLIFNGSTVISNAIAETEAPDINISAIPQCTENTNQNVLYKPDNIIEATKKNGTYPTTGTITYTKVAKIGSYKSDTLSYSIDGLDKVVIHTPVVCIPVVTADNDRFVQLIDPKSNHVQLVLDPDDKLSDFTVRISNTGFHSGKQGYYTRDFSRSIRNPDISYISLANALLKNQVRFPFDVYIDKGAAYDGSDDDYIKEGTWITLSRNTARFYLPMTVDEGVYTAEFRTISVNGEPYISNTETYANTQLNNYVATDRVNFEVSGRIYGLNIYDISDYPMWEEAFRVKNSYYLKKDRPSYTDGTKLSGYNANRFYTYSLGTNDQYGNDTGRDIKYTFPLVNGSHPQYKNQGILKTGYGFRFSLETTGNMFSDACMVVIKPNFYYVDKDGKNRKSVDLYYSETINNKSRHLVKAGSSLDQINLKKYMTGDLSLAIPEAEMRQTAKLRGQTYGEFTAKYSPMFNLSEIRLNWAFRTYTNNQYLNRIKEYASFDGLTADNIKEGDVLERMQRWYGQYYLPNEVHAVAKGFDVMDYADKYGVDYSEDFWLDEGYIIVNFSIETVGEDRTRRLSYINYSNYSNNNNCSMWLLENPPLSKVSYKGPTFNFYAGDCIIFYSQKRMTDDYKTGAIY